MPPVPSSPQPVMSVCVASYRRHRPPNLATLGTELSAAAGGVAVELIVVLNGISSNAARVPPVARTVRLGVNAGVPVAWNRGAHLARGTTLVFVNDDVSLGPQSLRLLHDALEANPDAGVAGPVGTRWDVAQARHIAYLPPAALAPGAVRDCDAVSGFLFATPRALWLQAGGFDERYTPCGFEEVDYCTTVRLVLGHRCLAVHGVPYEHEFGISARRGWRRVRWAGHAERIDSIARRNRAHFLRKWGAAADD